MEVGWKLILSIPIKSEASIRIIPTSDSFELKSKIDFEPIWIERYLEIFRDWFRMIRKQIIWF